MRPVGQGRGTNRASACVGRSRVCAQLIFRWQCLLFLPTLMANTGSNASGRVWSREKPGPVWLPAKARHATMRPATKQCHECGGGNAGHWLWRARPWRGDVWRASKQPPRSSSAPIGFGIRGYANISCSLPSLVALGLFSLTS
jgi:hypothetical protein